MASYQQVRRISKSSRKTARLHSADPLRLRKKKQEWINLQNQQRAEPPSSINSTLTSQNNKTINKPNSSKKQTYEERKSLCLNQYSVLQLHTARLSELSSSSRHKVSQSRKFQCSCLIQAARVT